MGGRGSGFINGPMMCKSHLIRELTWSDRGLGSLAGSVIQVRLAGLPNLYLLLGLPSVWSQGYWPTPYLLLRLPYVVFKRNFRPAAGNTYFLIIHPGFVNGPPGPGKGAPHESQFRGRCFFRSVRAI